MFTNGVTLTGLEAAIVWGYHTAASIRRWQVRRLEGGSWQLRAECQRSDAFQLRQRGLKFTAPRVGGFFCWPLVSAPTVTGDRLTATLGPPES